VTTVAQTIDLGMVHPVGRHRRPTGGKLVMTGITEITGTDVSRGFTAGGAAIVTTETVAGETGVVRNDGGNPGSGTVAQITFRGRRHMAGRLT